MVDLGNCLNYQRGFYGFNGIARMRRRYPEIFLLAALAAVLFFTGLGDAPLWDRDEPRNAGCAAEMLARGNWVVPIFNDQLRYQKPVLLYWLIMSAYSVFGVNEFAARFWSAGLAVGTVLATYVIGRRCFDAVVGWVAALALATSLMFVVAARAATPDSVLMFCSTTALMLFVIGTFRKHYDDSGTLVSRTVDWFPKSPWIFIPMYAVMGLGVLAKGPIGFLLPMAMMGLFGLIHNRSVPPTVSESSGILGRMVGWLREFGAVVNPVHFLKVLWSMRPLTAAALILLVALPWYIAVHVATEGDFTQIFFFSEHLGRATSAMENHSGGLWFYPLAILVGFFPWSCFWVPTWLQVSGTLRNRCSSENRVEMESATKAATVFLVCWVAVQVGVFSIARTKLPSYVTPCYPALAILTATTLVSYCRGLWVNAESSIHPGWMYSSLGGLVLSGFVMSGGLWFGMQRYLPEAMWLAVIGLVPVIAGSALCWCLYQRKVEWMLPGLSLSACLIVLSLFALGATTLGKYQRSVDLLASVRDREEVYVGTYRCLESSWVYYGQKPIVELLPVDEGTASPKSLERSRYWKQMPRLSLNRFADLTGKPKMIITTQQFVNEVKQQLPGFREVDSVPYFLKEQQLVLLSGEPIPKIVKQESTSQAALKR